MRSAHRAAGPAGRAAGRGRGAELAATLAIVWIFVAAAEPAQAQVSPGPLSRAHASLDGSLKCLECHASGKGGVAPQCLSCHKEIAWLAARDRGLHATIEGQDCATCHPEHAGVDFALIEWEEGSPEKFDHRRAGWPLAGKHAAQRCDACHKAAFRVSEAQRLAPRRDASRGWTGLETACGACHRDPHESTLGSDCARCHGTEGWRPAANFDHARSAYPLTGKHRDAACAKCHRVDGAPLVVAVRPAGGGTTTVPGALPAGTGVTQPLPRFKPLPHAECSACHIDPHAGQLGAQCSRCHVTDDFRRVAEGQFDHSRTRYPLRGRHVAVACAKCHDPRAGGARPRFDSCGACHADAHDGQATLAGRPADCAACHGVEGFRPATYTVAQHASARYPLEGKHRAVACAECHTRRPGGGGAQLRPSSGACRDCHADAHKGQLASRRDQGECGACHAPDGWKPARFGAVEHASTRFPLAGRHAGVACSACHGPVRLMLPPLPGPETLGTAKVALHLPDRACESCHRDPHAGRFGPKGDRSRAGGCADCHGNGGIMPSLFDLDDHAKSAFPLEGAHRAVPCVTCHAELGRTPRVPSLLLAGGGAPALEFRTRHGACRDCHDTPHGAQFDERRDGGACQACHGLDSFRPAARFDHAALKNFPLTGAHARVACARCHPVKQVDGRPVVTYRPIPRRCQDCHGRVPPQPAEERGSP